MTTPIEPAGNSGGSSGSSAEARRVLIAAAHTPAWDDVVSTMQAQGMECAWVPATTAPVSVAADLQRCQTLLIVDLAPDPVRGIALVTTCRQIARRSPVVVVADNPSLEFARRIRQSGVFYLAVHPVTGDEMCTVAGNAFECLARHRSASSLSRDKRHVLVVDDDADFVASISRLLESQGYAVAKAHNGHEALEKLRSEPPDLIVLDVMMEFDSSGYEVNQAVKFGAGFECFRHVPVLMVSSIQIDPATRFKMAGEVEMATPDVYMTKPIDIAEFLETVRALTGDVLDPSMATAHQ